MKRFRYHSLLLTVLVLTTTIGFAQRKKKPETPAVVSIKLREAEFHFTEGEKYFILEDYAKALVYYQKALELNPENATIHYKVAQVLSFSDTEDDLIRASLSIEQAIKLDKSNKFFYLLAARIYGGLTRFDKAAQAYESMIRNVPGTEEYLYELAAYYQYAGKWEDAIKTYDRAETFYGLNETSSLGRQRIYVEQKKKDEAIREGERLIEAFPDDEEYAVRFAETLSQFGQMQKAIELLENFVAQNEASPAASMLLAGLYRDTDQEEKSRKLLLEAFDNDDIDLTNKLIVLGTYNEELNREKSLSTIDTDRRDFALALLNKLLENYPEATSVHVIGGDLYLLIGREKDAESEYLNAIELGETNFEVWQNLLYLETRSGEFDKVVDHAESALEYFPNQAILYYFSGLANSRRRQFSAAISALEQAKKLASTNPALKSEINAVLGDTYHAAKEYSKSDKAYEEALAFNPSSEAVLNNYSYYLAIRKSNLDKAEKMAALLIKNNPENPTYLDTYAWVLFAREKYREAKKVIEKAINTGKANATHFEHYGDILYKLGDVDNAVKQWEKARGMSGSGNDILNKKISNRKIYE